MDYKHAQINDEGLVVGISSLAGIETERAELVYIADDDPLFDEITFGWRYVGEEWLEPSPPSEAELIEQEINAIENKLRQIYADEQYAEWLEGLGYAEPAPQVQQFSIGIGGAGADKWSLVQRLNELKAALAEL